MAPLQLATNPIPMKNTLPSSHGKRAKALCLGLLLACTPIAMAQVVKAVSQANGDTDRPEAQFTGNTVDIKNGATLIRAGYKVPLFGPRALCMTDRAHEWNAAATNAPIPPYLIGAPYVMIANNNRDNATLEVELQLNAPAKVFLLVDNRIGDNDAATPPDFASVMKWVVDGGWVATTNGLNRAANPSAPDEVGFDENGDGSINQVASVYVRTVTTGSVKLLQQGESRNMYGVVVVPSLIESVATLNGDPEAERPTPKRTGDQFTLVNGSSTLLANYWVPCFSPKAKAMTDRIHEWNAASDALPLPPYLLNNEYLAIANNYRDNPDLSINVTLAGKTLAYLLVDNRVGDNNGSNPPDLNANMTWVATDGWLPVATGRNRAAIADDPDEVGYDENADITINQVASIYFKVLEPGVVVLGPQNEGRNMYGLVVAPAVPPIAPSSLAVAKVGDGKVTLSWEAGTAWSYSVARSDKAEGPFDVIAPKVGGSTFEDTGLANGKTYFYLVKGQNGIGESGASLILPATPAASPSNVAATSSPAGVNLRWDSFPGATAYEVRRSLTPGGPYTTVASAVAGTSHADSTVPGGRNVYYVVVASLPGGESSGASPEASALTVPEAPVNIGVEPFSTQGVLVSWSSSNVVLDGFVVEQADASGNFTEVASAGARASRVPVGGLQPGQPGSFRVRARNASGISAPSSPASGSAAASGIFVNFANPTFTTGAAGYPLPGYADDYGDVFGDRGNGLSYGWLEDNAANSRHRTADVSPDARFDTLNHLQKNGGDMVWEMAVPSGRYSVRIVAGDATALDSVFQFTVEDVTTTTYTPTATAAWGTFDIEARIQDGLLSIRSGPSASNNKICFVALQPLPELPPTLSIEGSKVTFSGKLQEADAINGTFKDVSGATSPYQLPADAPQKFYRSSN